MALFANSALTLPAIKVLIPLTCLRIMHITVSTGLMIRVNALCFFLLTILVRAEEFFNQNDLPDPPLQDTDDQSGGDGDTGFDDDANNGGDLDYLPGDGGDFGNFDGFDGNDLGGGDGGFGDFGGGFDGGNPFSGMDQTDDFLSNLGKQPKGYPSPNFSTRFLRLDTLIIL